MRGDYKQGCQQAPRTNRPFFVGCFAIERTLPYRDDTYGDYYDYCMVMIPENHGNEYDSIFDATKMFSFMKLQSFSEGNGGNK